MGPLTTPDGRYLIVRGRLWRTANPGLGEQERQRLVSELMEARRAAKSAKFNGDEEALAAARRAVDSAKRGLGERGPVWWTDGAPDWNRHLWRTLPMRGGSRKWILARPHHGKELNMLKGEAKIDVPVYSDDEGDMEQGMDPIMHGILITPSDLRPVPGKPGVYVAEHKSPDVTVTVTVQADGSTTIETDPESDIFDNTLHV